MRWLAVVLASLSLAAAGCGKSAKAPAAVETHSTTGTVRGVGQDGRTITIAHQDFPGFMEGMVMTFDIDPKLSKDIKAGDKISFTISKDGDSWPVTSLKKVP